jgi:hypothetical protein
MREEKIDIIFGDGWEGLYVNGVLKDQEHSLSAESVVRALGFLNVNCDECDSDWLNEQGVLPDDIKDVQF